MRMAMAVTTTAGISRQACDQHEHSECQYQGFAHGYFQKYAQNKYAQNDKDATIIDPQRRPGAD